jgi:ankyrin repeat protein
MLAMRIKVICVVCTVCVATAIVRASGAGTPLIEAVKRDDRAATRALIKAGIPPNAHDPDGTTALHWAVHRSDVDLVDLLIGAGANVNATNRYGVMPLAVASINGDAVIMDRLLKAGADPNAVVPGGETVLMTAARTGTVDAVRTLLAHHADPNAHDPTGQTPIMWAADRNNSAAIRVLVEAGADVNARTHGAVSGPRKEGTQQSAFSFSSPTPTSFSPLLFAVRAGQRDSVATLLDLGASVNDALSDGTSALVLAVINGHWDIAASLLDRGADPNASAQGWTALHQISRTRRPNIGFGTPGAVPTGTMDSLELAKKLIARGANVNARMTRNGMRDGQRNRLNRLGATPFLLAAKSNDVEYMRLLLVSGADALMPNVDHTTPLMVAAGVAIWNPGEDGGSLVGSEPEVLEAVKLCVEAGADINAQNDRGETAMHGAAFRGANSVIEYLVSKGAKIDVRSQPYGWSPLTIANGIFYSDFFKEQKDTAALFRKLYEDRGISTEGHVAKQTDCLDCYQTRGDQAAAAMERDKRLEAEFAAGTKNH